MISLLRHSLAATLVSFVCFIAPGVRAQETGSSFGGGSFDDSSSGGSSYGGSYDSGGSDWGGSSYDGGGDGGSGGPATVFVLLMALLIVVVGSAIDRAKKGARVAEARPAPRAMDVSAISLAIDWHARRELQQRLDTLARSGDTRSKAGLVKLLRETVVAVRRLERSWLYAGVVNAKPSAPAAAEATFRRVTQEMRSRFRHELVRNADGATSTVDAPALRAREHEGAGVVVVTIAVAAKGEIPDVTRATNAAELREVMRRLGAIPALDLVAFEVIWSPSAENDRMSTAELEAIYPELRRIDEHTIGGRVFCGYCGSPFAAELVRCPHCGASASDAHPRAS